MRVLVMAAHPDDELLGVGGTIIRHIEAGDEVGIKLYDKCRQETWDKPKAVAKALGAEFIEAGVASWRPDIIYTHHTGDLNEHHREVAEAALVLGRFAQSIRTFETVSSTEWGFRPFLPNLYVSIEPMAKLDLLEQFYADELREEPHPRSITNITALAQLRGSVAGLDYAEAFMVLRERW